VSSEPVLALHFTGKKELASDIAVCRHY